MLFSDVFLSEIRSACPIESVAASYVQLKRRGRTLVCNCPFHSEKTPSCTIYPEQQSFHCYGCGAGGDVITFVRQIESLGFQDAVELLARRGGLTIPESQEEERRSRIRSRTLAINKEAANFYYRQLLGSDKTGLSYFVNRKLSPAIIKKYGLGFAPDSWNALTDHLRKKGFSEEELLTAGVAHRSKKGNLYDVFRNRVMFPIVDVRGNVIGFGGRVMDDSQPKYLNSAVTPVFDKGKNLFSLNFAKDAASSVMILAEGYMDVIAVHQAGFPNVVATLGTAITAEQARKIAQYASEVIIAYDSDGAGQKAAQKAITHFGAVGITTRILHMEGAKDPDEYIKRFGADRFRLLLEQAGDAITFRMEHAKIGLDLSQESDRAKWLNRLVEILAGVPNRLTRDVYISKAASEASITPEVLRDQVEYQIRRSARAQKKNDWDTLKRQTAPVQQRTPEGEAAQRLERSETLLLGYLLTHPEELPQVRQKLSGQQLSAPIVQKVFPILCQLHDAQQNSSLSVLGQYLSTDEMGRLSQILAHQREFPVNSQTADDCIRILREQTPQTPENDADLLRLIEQKKHRPGL